MKLALCGKGGSGKSTVAVLLANTLVDRGYKVLVIDADESNSGLYRKLGFSHAPIPIMDIVGGRQGIKDKKSEKYIIGETKISTGLLEKEVIFIEDIPEHNIIKADGLRLIQIGKINQAMEGCACPMGLLNREFLDKLSLKDDEMVIVDTEAGLEHFGRGMESGIDGILIIVDPSVEAVEFAEKAYLLSKSLNVSNIWILLNRADSQSTRQKLISRLKQRNIRVDVSIPYDARIFEAELDGKSVSASIAQVSINKLVSRILKEKSKD